MTSSGVDTSNRESTPPLPRPGSVDQGDESGSGLGHASIRKTPRTRRKSDIHDLLPEMLIRHESEGSVFRVLSPRESITDFFSIDESFYALGAKSVSRCIQKSTMKRYVVKRRLKDGYGSDVERHWRRVMEKLLRAEPFRHIVSIAEVLEDESAFYIVMEECNGGQLFDLLLKESSMSTRELKRIIREILQAVEYLHDLGLIHRDIKPENIMLTKYENEVVIKLIDFDTCEEIVPRRLSMTVNHGDRLVRRRSTRIVGTLGYVAPESFNGEYSTASDMFSIGVIFYILLTGDMPFDDSIFHSKLPENENDFEVVGSPRSMHVQSGLMRSVIDWNISPWPQVPLARDLCQKLLEFDPEKRIKTCEEALSHPWLAQGGMSVPPTPSRHN